jgi:hypothetical protein
VEQLYQSYKDRAEFLLVYIREAHPDSVLFVARDGEESLEKVLQTDSLDARSANAQVCCETLKLSFPAVVDRDDNFVNEAYAGWPDRFVIVGSDGRVAYYGPPGPGGFRPREVEEWLRENTRE